jgi:hypothetical protein
MRIIKRSHEREKRGERGRMMWNCREREILCGRLCKRLKKYLRTPLLVYIYIIDIIDYSGGSKKQKKKGEDLRRALTTLDQIKHFHRNNKDLLAVCNASFNYTNCFQQTS